MQKDIKHFFVSDEVGNPIYFDHPQGRMLCMPIATTHGVMFEAFEDIFQSMQAGNLKFVFQRYGPSDSPLSFTAISGNGEDIYCQSESFLRRQLRTVHEVLLLIWGPNILYQNRHKVSFHKHQKFLQKLMDTMVWLSEHQQGFLIESIEKVEIHSSIQEQAYKELQKASSEIPNAQYSLLFVGTKLLTSWAKSGFELNPSDIFLLIIYYMGHFHPRFRNMEEMELPKSDYSDAGTISVGGSSNQNQNDELKDIKNENNYQNIKSSETLKKSRKSFTEDSSETDKGFLSAVEDWEDDSFSPGVFDRENSNFFLDPEITLLFDEILQEFGILGQYKVQLQNCILYLLSKLSDGTFGYPLLLMKTLKKIIFSGCTKKKDVQLLQCLLSIIGYFKENISGEYNEVTRDGVGRFQKDNNLEIGGCDRNTIKPLFLKVLNSSLLQEGKFEFSSPQIIPRLSPKVNHFSHQNEYITPLKALHPENTSRSLNDTTILRNFNENIPSKSLNENTPSRIFQEKIKSRSILSSDINNNNSKPLHNNNKHNQSIPIPIEKKTKQSESFLESKTTNVNNNLLKSEEDEEEFVSAPNSPTFTSPFHQANKNINSVLLEDDNENDTLKTDSVIAQVFLRSPKEYSPYTVYCAELDKPMNLVIISNPGSNTPQDKELFAEAKAKINKGVKVHVPFFMFKEHTNSSALPYLHDVPGLVHFIFVDRTDNKIIAPPLTSLRGIQYVQSEKEERRITHLLKRHIWDMCYNAQKHLSLGYCSMLMKEGTFQYAYRLWVEDVEGKELPFEKPIPKGEVSPPFYKELVKGIPHAAKCFELYTLYLSVVAVNMIGKLERKLKDNIHKSIHK